jgi:hypothetical protein
MAFQVVDESWVDHHATIVKGILMHHCDKDQSYTNPGLIAILSEQGFEYSMADFQKIRAELVKRGILEGED